MELTPKKARAPGTPAPTAPGRGDSPFSNGTEPDAAFILRRILIAIPTLMLVSVFVFMLQNCCRAIRSWPWRARNATPRCSSFCARSTA
jgi:hypothetical protein